MEKGPWEEWWAVIPVEVDAYSEEERKDGRFSYKVMGKVLRRWVELLPENYQNDQDEIPAHWEYKPYKEEDVGK